MIDGGIIEYARQCREKGLPIKFRGKTSSSTSAWAKRSAGRSSPAASVYQPAIRNINCITMPYPLHPMQKCAGNTCSLLPECSDFVATRGNIGALRGKWSSTGTEILKRYKVTGRMSWCWVKEGQAIRSARPLLKEFPMPILISSSAKYSSFDLGPSTGE